MGRGSEPDPWRNSHFGNPPASAARPAQRAHGRPTAQGGGAGQSQPTSGSGWATGRSGWEAAAGTGSTQSWSSATGGARSGGRPEFVRAPLTYLWISYGAALLALAAALIPAGVGLWIGGWLLAAFFGLGAALLFTLRDAILQGETFYLHVPSARWFYQGAIAISLIAIVANALRIALVIGRLG